MDIEHSSRGGRWKRTAQQHSSWIISASRLGRTRLRLPRPSRRTSLRSPARSATPIASARRFAAFFCDWRPNTDPRQPVRSSDFCTPRSARNGLRASRIGSGVRRIGRCGMTPPRLREVAPGRVALAGPRVRDPRARRVDLGASRGRSGQPGRRTSRRQTPQRRRRSRASPQRQPHPAPTRHAACVPPRKRATTP